MATAGIPNIGDTAAGHWGDTSVIGRVVSKSGGTQLALFGDKFRDNPGPAQVVTVYDAVLVATAPPQWSKDLARAEQLADAKHEQWREGIEARRIEALQRAEAITARIAAARQRNAERSHGIEREP